jgi:HK97 family phage prohead protease
MSQRFLLGGTQPLGDGEIGVIAASSELARDGHVLVVEGLSLENYRKNPIVLWDHNPSEPIGACTAIGVVGGELAARLELSDISTKAQEIRAFAKSGIVKGVSIGFDPVDVEPLDPSKPRGGQRITKSELFEISLVSIPADVNGQVIARGYKARHGASTMLRSLPSVAAAAVERALSQIGRGQPPLMSMSVYERTQYYSKQAAQRTMAVWGLQQGERERESLSREEREADLRALRDK